MTMPNCIIPAANQSCHQILWADMCNDACIGGEAGQVLKEVLARGLWWVCGSFPLFIKLCLGHGLELTHEMVHVLTVWAGETTADGVHSEPHLECLLPEPLPLQSHMTKGVLEISEIIQVPCLCLWVRCGCPPILSLRGEHVIDLVALPHHLLDLLLSQLLVLAQSLLQF